MMKLNLRDLHIDILKHNRTYDVFDYSHNGIQFSVMFDVDCIPFKLILVKKRSTQYLILDVMAGYQINTYLGEKLQLLKDMLELKNGKTKFSTNQFFEEFNKKIPHTIQNKKISKSTISRVYHCEEKLDFTYWNEPIQDLKGAGMSVVVSPKANEQLNMTRDLTEFLYYETTVMMPQEECTLSIGGTDANAFVAFLDDQYMGADDEHTHKDGWHTMYIKMKGSVGEHKLTILSESLGVSNSMNSNQDPTWASQRLKGICGWIKLCDNDIFNQKWSHYPGLVGEVKQVFTEAGAAQVEWKKDLENAAPLAWYRSSFKTPVGLNRNLQLLLRPEGMNRGQAYVNGHNIGRYWMIKDTNGEYTQGYYHIPRDWLNPVGEENTLFLGETLGADEPNVTICTTEYINN